MSEFATVRRAQGSDKPGHRLDLPASEGQTDEESAANPLVPFEVGGSEYFRTVGTHPLRGRGFLESDRADAPPWWW